MDNRRERWFWNNRYNFSREMNGYSTPPVGPYISTLPYISRGGKIADLGCGNGMLLKFLMEFSNQQLDPYGIDRKEAPIRRARELLPRYKEHFRVCNVDDYDFKEGPFGTVIAGPFYAHDRTGFAEKCIDNLEKGGRLLYRVHYDALKDEGASRLEDFPYLQRLGLKEKKDKNIIFWTFDKK